MNSKWMTLEEAAAYLKCGINLLRELVANEQVPFSRLDGGPVFHADRLDEWMFAREKGTERSFPEGEDPCLIHPDCDREKVGEIVEEMLSAEANPRKWGTDLAKNLKACLTKSEYKRLTPKVRYQLSKWCWPNRNTAREQWVQPRASEISKLLFGEVIKREKLPGY